MSLNEFGAEARRPVEVDACIASSRDTVSIQSNSSGVGLDTQARVTYGMNRHWCGEFGKQPLGRRSVPVTGQLADGVIRYSLDVAGRCYPYWLSALPMTQFGITKPMLDFATVDLVRA